MEFSHVQHVRFARSKRQPLELSRDKIKFLGRLQRVFDPIVSRR